MNDSLKTQNKNEKIYNKINELTGLKFKAQLKNSGIKFEKIIYLKNLINNNETYALTTNGKVIYFFDKIDFIIEFHNFILDSINDLEKEFEDLQKDNRDYLIMGGENAVYLKHEEIGLHTGKQTKLLEKFKEFHSKIPSNKKE